MKLHVSIILCAVLLGGCTRGRFFEKPTETSVTLGVTTKYAILQAYGPPQSRSRQSKPKPDGATPSAFDAAAVEGSWESLAYTYENRVGVQWGAGLKLRAVTFRFWNEQLVAYYFVSNLEEDGPPLDESKLDAIIKGKTTRAEAEQLLGPPASRAIYPAIRDRGSERLGYTYLALNRYSRKTTTKQLSLLIDANGVVQDYQFFMDVR